MTTLVDLGLVLAEDGSTDLPDDDAALAEGADCVADGVMARWVLTPGDLWEDEGAGADLLSYRDDGLTPADQAALQSKLQAEAALEDGVVDCTATAVLDGARQLLAVRGELATDDGSAPLNVPLTPATAAAIAAGG